MKFSIGDKVIEKKSIQACQSYHIMEVVGTLNDALIVQPWGDSFDGEIRHFEFYDEDVPGTRGWRESIQRFQEEELFTPEEALTELRRLENERSKIEEDFDKVRAFIQNKLDEAAFLIKEAAIVSKFHKKEFLDLKKECMSLYEALDSGGWRHSYMRC